METCYKCNRHSCTREHVPPKSFFPENKRNNLITVPSCEKHNLDNSPDVEYVRNILTCFLQANHEGIKLGVTKTYRSFKRSQKLLHSTFRSSSPIKINNDNSAIVQYDIIRFDNIMKSIADAIYFHENKHRNNSDWKVFNCSAFDISEFRDKETHDSLNLIRRASQSIEFEEVITSNPEIFKYYKKQETTKLCYKFMFYGGIEIILKILLLHIK